MESIRKRVVTLGIIFLALGATFMATSQTKHLRTEKWMLDHTPKEFAGYRMVVTDPEKNLNGEVSYVMDEYTYKELHPYGIVARVFVRQQGMRKESFDAVIIMSNQKDSFHDPRVCFSAQGWTIASEQVESVNTKAYGEVKYSLVTMINGGRKAFAAYFYRGPEGYCATTNQVKMQMLKHQMFKLQDAEGAFYRIIPLQDNAKPEDLKVFIDEFLTATKESSKGLL